MTDTNTSFNPTWVSPPGDTIAELLEEKGWSQQELAQRLGYTPKHLSQLVNGKVPLSEDAAMRLERVLGSTARFWLSREALYRERLARLGEHQKLSGWVDWLEDLPLKDLMQMGEISAARLEKKNYPSLVDAMLQFFGVASPDEWKARYVGMQLCFRRTREDQSHIGAISSWLRLGERRAEKLDGPKYDQAKFEEALPEIRKLTKVADGSFKSQLLELCRNSGVTLVIVPSIRGAHVSGVARWLSPQRPLIQLSMYGKSNDKFWFTFFHEAAHLLLHGNEKKAVFLDDGSVEGESSRQEKEANKWAADFLIPVERQDVLPYLKTKAEVKRFAGEIGVHTGIVVGRLQHSRTISQKWMNDLKVSFEAKES